MTTLTMSKSLSAAFKGTEDAPYFQEAILDPFEKSTTPTTRKMAHAMLAVMDLFATRRELGARTQLAFQYAFSAMGRATGSNETVRDDLYDGACKINEALALAPGAARYRGLKHSDHLFIVMGAAVTATARAMIGDLSDDENPFPEGSALHSAHSAQMFLLHLHGSVELREKEQAATLFTEMSDKDVLKTRIVLDIANGVLPHISSERVAAERHQRIMALMSNPDAMRETVTLRTMKSDNFQAAAGEI